jgi:hypothetical protein
VQVFHRRVQVRRLRRLLLLLVEGGGGDKSTERSPVRDK